MEAHGNDLSLSTTTNRRSLKKLPWAKFDDGYDEETETLSDRAFRLYTCAVTYSRRRGLAGVLVPKDTAALLRRFKANSRHTDELCEGESHEALWLRDGENFLIRSYEKFNPLTSTERVRKHLAKKQSQTFINAPDAFSKQNRTSLARASATGLETNSTSGREPDPVPDPVPVPLPPVAPPPPEVLELQLSLSRVLGIVQPRGGDVLIVQRFWDDFHARYEGVVDMVTTVELDIARREREGREPIHSLEGCRIPLRWEHDMRADRGAPHRSSAGVAGLDMEPLAAILPLAARSE